MKNVCSLIILLSFFFVSCSREDMFGNAQNGSYTIYAVDSSTNVLIVANDYGYYKEYPLNLAQTARNIIFADNKLYMVVNTGNVRIMDFDGGGSVQTVAALSTADAGITYFNGNVYLGSSSTSNIYRINDDLTYASIPTSPVYPVYKVANDGKKLYSIRNATSNPEFYVYNGASFASPNVISYNFSTGVVYFNFIKNTMYVADPTYMIAVSDYGVAPASPINSTAITLSGTSYCVDDDGNIFAAGHNGSSAVLILKFDGSNFVTLTSIPTATFTTVSLASLQSGKLAVGIYSGSSAKGLYIYDWKNNTLKSINSTYDIAAVCVSR